MATYSLRPSAPRPTVDRRPRTRQTCAASLNAAALAEALLARAVAESAAKAAAVSAARAAGANSRAQFSERVASLAAATDGLAIQTITENQARAEAMVRATAQRRERRGWR